MKGISTILPVCISLSLANSFGTAGQPDPRPPFVDIAFLSDTRCVSVAKHAQFGTLQFYVWDLAQGRRVKELFWGKLHWFASATCFAFSPDARYVACGKWDGTIAIFSLENEKEVLSFPTAQVPTPQNGLRMNEIAWSPDGKAIASTDHEKVLYLWDAQTGKEIAKLAVQQPIHQLALAPDGKSVLLGPRLRGDPNKREDLRPRLVDLATGQVHHQFLRDGEGVAFSPDGNLAAVFGERLEVWDVRAKTKKIDLAVIDLAEMKDKSCSLYSVVFTPDSKKLITTGMGHRIQVVDVASGKVVVRCESGGSPTWFQAKLSPGGRRIIGFANQGLVQWDAATGEEISTLSGFPVAMPPGARPIRPQGFAPDNRHLLVYDVAGQAHLMDFHTGKVVRSFKDKSTAIVQAALTADGEQVVTQNLAGDSWDGKFLVFDVKTGKMLKSFLLKYPADYPGYVLPHPFALSPDGKQAMVDLAGTIRVVSLMDGKEITKLNDMRFGVFCPDGRTTITWGNGTIAVSGLPDARPRIIPCNLEMVHLLKVSPDSKQFLTTGSKLALWDIASGKTIRVLDEDGIQYCAVAFSPDGSFALTGRWDHMIQLWDLKSAKVVRYFVGKGVVGSGSFIFFSPDGRFAAAGTGVVRIWDVASGRVVRELTIPN